MSIAAFTPLSKQDVAEILGVSIRTIENFVAQGRMPAPARIGARVLWHPDVFYSWLDQALRTGGWQDDIEGERTEQSRAAVPTDALLSSTSKRAKAARSRPSATSRLQARQAILLSDLAAQ